MNLEITEYLKENVLLFDGAMGTYFSSVYDDPSYKCEYANITSPNTIREIHRRYLGAGAKAIKSNTFSLNDTNDNHFDYKEIIQAGFKIAFEEGSKYNAFVFANIGPLNTIATTEDVVFTEYKKIIDEFILQGATCFLFETLHEIGIINEIANYIKQNVKNSYIIASFAINSDGFTKTGEFRDILIKNVDKNIDSVGFNCVCAPLHMNKHIESVVCDKPLVASPNASYPKVALNRVSYQNNSKYFAKEMLNIAQNGAKIIGGCCGTTPEFISEINKNLVDIKINKSIQQKTKIPKENSIKTSDFYRKLTSGEKPIAVELDSPANTEISTFMNNAKLLGDTGVDLITIADCPAARPRMDSSLVACKIRRELGIHTMPHLTCRDRNINASRALLLGLSVEDINDILIITGDPIPSELRDEVKSVYEFNSRKLINHINILNDILFDSPFYLYGALNINAVNFNAQLKQATEKIEKGAVSFFTQPVLSERAFENLKIAKKELNVPIVGGVMPIVSYKNACFINNEISGIDICDEIVNMYIDKTREESEEIAFNVTCEIIERIRDFIDGYYIITPFSRAELVSRIIKNIK